jgi:DNA repair protein RecO (recombination protein O)
VAAIAVPALVLQSFPYGETSRVLRLLTPELGVQSVIARGADRPRSRFGALDPFSRGTAMLHVRPNRELQTLAGFDLARSHHGLGHDLIRFGGASLLAEITLRTGSQAAQPDLFEAVSSALDHLEQVPAEALEAGILARTWHLVAILGFAPALDFCLTCGREILAAEEAWLDFGAGGVHCSTCAPGRGGRALPPHARAALALMVGGESASMPRTEGHWVVLERFLAHHVMEGASLRSFAFLADALAR